MHVVLASDWKDDSLYHLHRQVHWNNSVSADKCLCDQNILIYCQCACCVVLLEKVPNLIILYSGTMDLCFNIVPYTGER